MVIFFTILLCISIVGLIGLLGIRHYELSSERVIFANVRPTASALLGDALHVVERQAPAWGRRLALRLYAVAREWLHRGVAFAVLHTERFLEQTLTVLRHTTAKDGGGEASAFLREVAEHKKDLLKKSETRGAIYEE